jgi:hypothetical protein
VGELIFAKVLKNDEMAEIRALTIRAVAEPCGPFPSSGFLGPSLRMEKLL